MTTHNIFGAYDIRGKYPEEINEKVVSEITRCLVLYFKPGSKIVVAHDNRLSSPSLYQTIIKQFKIQNPRLRRGFGGQAKFKIIEVGLATTPMFYFLVKKLKAAGGIMITASHNPPNWNGLKIVDENALSISGKEILKLLNH